MKKHDQVLRTKQCFALLRVQYHLSKGSGSNCLGQWVGDDNRITIEY